MPSAPSLSHSRTVLRVVATLAILLAWACDAPESSSGPTQRDPLTPSAGSASQVRFGVRTFDEEFASIADRAPGFAGLFWDSAGRLVIKTTTEADPAVIRDTVSDDETARRFRDVPRALQEGRIRLTADALYDFRQLMDWREALRPALATTGVVHSSIDEVRNSIRIGISSATVEDQVRRAAVALGIPADAVSFEAGEAFQPLTDLQDRFRPMPGGVQVAGWQEGTCTNGANVLTDVGIGFITASHCTATFWDLDQVTFYQPIWGDASNYVGWEWSDPDPFTGGLCDGYDACRYSDAAFIRIVGSGVAEHGYIARTTSGSIDINLQHPRFTIVSEGGWPLENAEIHKVGRTSGLTSGYVTDTCVDIPHVVVEGWVHLCQFVTDVYADYGDSGGPVFTWPSGSDVVLEGILVGGNATSMFFSSWTYVVLEIGADVGTLTAVQQ